MNVIAGIDYGSKMAGTTAIAIVVNGHLHLFSALKNRDADAFISKTLHANKVNLAGIDAPLSLPEVYSGRESKEYFYRACDKELRAMSPMFLGGLTARAIKLKAALEGEGVKLIEVYPASTAKRLHLEQFNYKKKEADYVQMLQILQPVLSFNSFDEPKNSHEMDAVLALHTTVLAADNQAQVTGKASEGLIFF